MEVTMKTIEGLYYSKEHEWIRVEGEKAYIGITDYAQHALGDIVYVELPEVDDELEINDVIGVVESVKAASDVYSPISCKIIAVNEELEDSPENLNEDPYNNHIAVVEITNPEELDDLMDYKQYEAYCQEE